MGALMIAGTHSGSGKTTVSIGLMAALCKRGLRVQSFKAGPDYIDPGFHAFVTGRPGYNLDAWMMDDETLRFVRSYALEDADIGIAEGVMGLYDGYGVTSPIASTAHVAAIAGFPVVLVIDGHGMSASAAAFVLGFSGFDPAFPIAGVIVNRVSGQAHYDMIRRAVEQKTGIPCLGYIPQSEPISLGSRHLGLIPAAEVADLRGRIDRLAELTAKHVQIDRLINLAALHSAPPTPMPAGLNAFLDQNAGRFTGLRIGIARDEAFSFYYQSNLDLLTWLGARWVPLSPLHDHALPPDLHALYLGGGFPEVFAQALSANTRFMTDLKARLEGGLACYAECGGMMYLTRGITTLDGRTHPMTGYLDAVSRMTEGLQRFGYVTVRYEDLVMPAHEFHHSLLAEDQGADYRYVVEKYREGSPVRQWRCGIARDHTLAGYPHFSFLSNPQFVRKVFSHG